MSAPGALENLSGPGKALKAEPPDAQELAGLTRTGRRIFIRLDGSHQAFTA